MCSNRRAQRGFTMIELLVVLVILSLTSALVLPKFPALYERFKSKSEQDKFEQGLSSLGLKAYTEQTTIILTAETAKQWLDIPADWQLEINQPIVYKPNGVCLGGELHLLMKGVTRNIKLTLPYCDPAS